MKIAITGHRPHKLGKDYDLTSPLIAKIRTEIEVIVAREKPTHLISGMALGIDTLFAQIAISMGIELIAAIPCKEQYIKWQRKSIDLWFNIVEHKDTTPVLVHSGRYNKTCMNLRNEWMVDRCDLLIAVWDGSTGGTFNCVTYAHSKDKRVIRLNPKDYQ